MLHPTELQIWALNTRLQIPNSHLNQSSFKVVKHYGVVCENKKKRFLDLLKNFNFLFDSTTPQAEPDPRKLCLYFVRLFLLYRVISLSLSFSIRTPNWLGWQKAISKVFSTFYCFSTTPLSSSFSFFFFIKILLYHKS